MPSRRTLVASTCLALLTGGLGLGTAQATTDTLYVNVATSTCNDTGPGTQAEPYCQIQAAANAARPGDTVDIAGGTYAPFTLTTQGTATAPVTFVGSGYSRPYVQATSGPAITFSGAQYVDVSGVNAHANGTSAVVVDRSQHITYDQGHFGAFPASGATSTPAPVVAVDGSSADVSFTRGGVLAAPGWAYSIASGAQNVTLASEFMTNAHIGGVQAVGTNGVHLAGDTITSYCGDAVSLTGTTSGTVENTVAAPALGGACTGDSTPAEISVDASSAGQVTADYNALNPGSTGSDYSWSGTAYSTTQAFRATGQGAHDLDQTSWTNGRLTEHSPLIDSANADAPGELETDAYGRHRVDDPLVTDAGAGASGYYDRGAAEFQDPLALTGLTVSPTTVYATEPATFTAKVYNPWADSGMSYAFSFGDGTSAGSATNSASHTYAQGLAGTTAYPSVTLTTAAGTASGPASTSVTVNAIPALFSEFGCSGAASPTAPDTAACGYSVTSHYPLTSGQIVFGDGSAPVGFSDTGGTLTHTYPAPGHYTATEKVADDHGRTFTATSSVTVGAAYVPDGPTRVLDTRYGIGAPKRPVGPGGVVRLKVADVDGIPSTGVTAVVMNVTDTDATADSFVTAYPDGTTVPNASNLNFKAGQTNPNLVTVEVGKDGYVDLYNRYGSTDLIADLAGYYTTTPSAPNVTDERMGYLAPTGPSRVLDTRYGTGAAKAPLGPNSTLTINVPQLDHPSTVGALLNITVTGATADSFLTVYCGSAYPPNSSNVNFRRGQTTSSLVLADVCAGGQIEIYNRAGSVNVIADLQGVYTNVLASDGTDRVDLSGSPLISTAPTRVLDTRYGTGAAKARLSPGGTLSLKVAGVGAVPAGAWAVLVNLTAVGPTTGTYLTAYGDGPRPNASNLNLAAGETRPLLALVPVDANGCIHIYNHAGYVDVIADLAGYVGI